MSISKVMDEALEAFAQGSIDTAREVLDAALQSGAALRHIEDTFAVCCFRGALAAMEGATQIAELLAPCKGFPLQEMMTLYFEGLSEMAVGKFPLARHKFERLKKISWDTGSSSSAPGETTCFLANLGLAAVYFKQRQYKESFSEYRTVMEALGSEAAPRVVRVGMGMCAFCLDEPAYAKKILEREVRMHPDNDLALLALLVVYVHLRLMPAVMDTVLKLRERLPENTAILLRAADLLYFRAIELKNVKSAVPAILSILQRVRLTGTAEEIALADYQEGRLRIVLGEFEMAEQLLEASFSVLPQLLPARIHYAHLLVLTRREQMGLSELLKLNENGPHKDQKEVLQLLACHVSERGSHEAALRYCRRLIDSVAPGDVCSWALAAWCSRLDQKESLKRHKQLIKIQKELELNPSWEVLANEAVLAEDVDALQALADRTLGASYLPSLTSGKSPLAELQVAHVPLVYNLALLKERSDRGFARHLYTYLVKTHCTFTDSYFRLYELAKEEKYYKQSVMWLTLLSRVMEKQGRSATLANAFIGVSFFEHQEFRTAVKLLRPVNVNTAAGSTPPLCLAVFYLRLAQCRVRNTSNYLKMAKAQFEKVLKCDTGNLLAAHGLACCLGIDLRYDLSQSLLHHVRESRPNRSYVHKGLRGHLSIVATGVEKYKQAIDYLPQDPKERDVSQSSRLAFCYATESNFTRATEILMDAMRRWPDHTMLQYNASLIYCAAFIDGVENSSAATEERGMELRNLLQEAVNLAFPFIDLKPESRVVVIAQSYLKGVLKYCLTVLSRRLQPIIAVGMEQQKQQEQAAIAWMEAMQTYNASKKEKQETLKALQQQQQEERAAAQRDIEERFKAGVFQLPAALLKPDLVEYIRTHLDDDNFAEAPELDASQLGELMNDDLMGEDFAG